MQRFKVDVQRTLGRVVRAEMLEDRLVEVGGLQPGDGADEVVAQPSDVEHADRKAGIPAAIDEVLVRRIGGGVLSLERLD